MSSMSSTDTGDHKRGGVILRATQPADLDFVLQAEQDPDTRPFIIPWSREQHVEALSHPDLVYRIISAPDNRSLGFLILAGLRNSHHSVEFRRIVVTEKGQGTGRSAIRLVKRWAFTELGAHRLWLDVKENNHRARRLYTSEGFIVEGTLRECLKGESGYESLVLLSMLAREYKGS